MNAKDFLLEENPDKEPMPFGAVVNVMEAYANSKDDEQSDSSQTAEREDWEANKEIETLKKCLYEYGEWARGNGERFRGNLQKNNEELFNQFLKEREQWKSVNSSF